MLRLPLAVLPAVLPAVLLASGGAPVGGPVPFESPAGFVVLKGRIDGHSDVRLLLDTGDPGGVTLRTDRAEALGLPFLGGAPKLAVGLAGSTHVVLGRSRLRTLEVGGVLTHDLEIGIAPAAGAFLRSLGVEVDGYLGVESLRGRTVTIDYPERRIAFAAGDAADSRYHRGAPLRLATNRIVVDVVLAGSARRAMILDTAAAATLLSSEDRDLTLPAPGAVTRIVDGGGSTAILTARILPSLAVGGAILSRVQVALFDPGEAPRGLLAGLPPSVSGILGSDVLSRSIVIIDLRNLSLRLLPAGR